MFLDLHDAQEGLQGDLHTCERLRIDTRGALFEVLYERPVSLHDARDHRDDIPA